jgi:hypothetical protein
LLHFSATIESRIKIQAPFQLGHLAFMHFWLASVSVALMDFFQLSMSAAAFNTARVSPGDVLGTQSRPIPRLPKSIAVASGKLYGTGSLCHSCIRILDGPDILTSTP